jgi:hypothetical protein
VDDWLPRLSILIGLHIRRLVKEWSIWSSLLECWSKSSMANCLTLEQGVLAWLIPAFFLCVWVVLKILLEHILYLIYSLTVINKLIALFIAMMLLWCGSSLIGRERSLNWASSWSVRVHLILRLIMLNPFLDFNIDLCLGCLQLFSHIIPEILPNIQNVIVRLRRNKGQRLFLTRSWQCVILSCWGHVWFRRCHLCLVLGGNALVGRRGILISVVCAHLSF